MIVQADGLLVGRSKPQSFLRHRGSSGIGIINKVELKL